MQPEKFEKNWQYYKFCFYGFLKNQRFFEFFLLLIFYQIKGLNLSLIGMLYSIRFIFRALFEIPSGFMADAMGRRSIMLIAYAVYMVSFIGYHFANTFLWLIIPSILFGIADAFRTGTHKAMIFEYLKRNGWQDQKVEYYGHTRSWSQFGSSLSSLIGAALVLFGGGYQYIFLFSLIPYALGFILLVTYPAYLDGTSMQKESIKYWMEFTRIFKMSVASLKNFTNLRLAFNVATFSGFFNAAKDYIQIIISAVALSIPIYINLKRTSDEKEIVLIGLVYFLIYLLTATASRNTSYIGKLFSSFDKYLNILLLLGIGIGLVAGSFFQTKYFAVSLTFFVFIFVIENLRRPAGVAAIAGQFDEKILASILSIESQLSSVLGAIMSVTIGLMADKFGPGYALSIMAVVLILFYPLLRIVKPKY
jgi:MFS family permease